MSYFKSDTETRARLEGDEQADVCVIGAGLTGILTAWRLRQEHADVKVIERASLFEGETARTTAKITAVHGMKYARLINNLGFNAAKSYYLAMLDGMEWMVSAAAEAGGDCELKKMPIVLYAENAGSELLAEYAAVSRLNMDASLTNDTQLPFRVKNAIRFENAYAFNPLKLMDRMAAQLDIRTQSPALRVEGNRVICKRGSIRAKHIVVATHFPFINMPGLYFTKMHQEKSYAAAVRGVPAISEMYVSAESGYAFRPCGNDIIISGLSHRTGDHGEQNRFETMEKDIRSFYPSPAIADTWSAEDCMPPDGVPYIGRYSKFTDNLYVATGFGKWGMTTAAAAALILSGAICGEEKPYARIFSPARRLAGEGKKQLSSQMRSTVRGLAKSVSRIPAGSADDIPVNTAAVIRVDGKRTGVYRDSAGALHYAKAVCPHLGCALSFNTSDKTWDCPCHGSRFDMDGRLLGGPAQRGTCKAENRMY